jgi:predicted XRE-type DNA-binding protein
MTETIGQSSGNVFADLGLCISGQELLKAQLTLQVNRLLKQRGMSQSDAAKLLGTTQPQVSALMGLKPVAVSVGRLMEFLTVLGQDVQVRVKPTPQLKAGHLTVQVGAQGLTPPPRPYRSSPAIGAAPPCRDMISSNRLRLPLAARAMK